MHSPQATPARRRWLGPAIVAVAALAAVGAAAALIGAPPPAEAAAPTGPGLRGVPFPPDVPFLVPPVPPVPAIAPVQPLPPDFAFALDELGPGVAEAIEEAMAEAHQAAEAGRLAAHEARREARAAQLDAHREQMEAHREALRAARDAMRAAREEVRMAFGGKHDWGHDLDDDEEAGDEAGSGRDGARAFGRAHNDHRRGRYEKAIAGFEEAARLGYRKATAYYNAACGHARLGHTDQALDHLNRAIDAGFDPGDYLDLDQDLVSLRKDPRFQALREQYGSGLANRAMRRLERMEASGAADGDDFYDAGMDLHRLGEYDAAIRAWRRSAELEHRAAASTYNIACAHALKGDRAAALDALARAIDLGYGDADSIDGDDDLASLRDDPRYRELLVTADVLDLPGDGGWSRGSWKRRDGSRWEKALARYQEYLKAHPQSGRAWFNVGFAQLRLDRHAAAAEAFQKAHALGHRKGTSAYNTACAYAMADDKDRAFEWLARARADGFDSDWHLAEDPDLDNIRDDPRFPEVELERGHRSWKRFWK